MSFLEGVVSGFKGVATFSGRARRMELFSYGIVVGLLFLVVLYCVVMSDALYSPEVLQVTADLYLLSMLAVMWRRYHDVGQEGCMSLVLIVATYGNGLVADLGFTGDYIVRSLLLGVSAWTLYKLIQDGDKGGNAHGASPKYIDENSDDKKVSL